MVRHFIRTQTYSCTALYLFFYVYLKMVTIPFLKDCPTKAGYVSYTTGGCCGRDEIASSPFHVSSRELCHGKCNENPNCVSLEIKQGNKKLFYCLLSSSCTYDISIREEGFRKRTGWCFYEKQGNKAYTCQAINFYNR